MKARLDIKQRWNNIPITIKVSVAYTVCSIIQYGLGFITLPIFVRMLTTSEYGDYTIYSSWMGILTIFLTLNLAFGSFSTAMVKYEDDRDGYISSIEGVFFVLSIIGLLIYLPLRRQWNSLFELPTKIVLVMFAEIICTASFQLWCGKKRFEMKYIGVVLVTLLISLIAPIFAFVLVKSSSQKGYARIIGYSATNILVGGFFCLYNIVKGKKLINKQYWKYALGFNIPLIIYYLSQVVFNQSDRVMISHMVGKDKAAIYGVAYSLATILAFVLNAVNSSYVPWFYQKIKNNEGEENKKISVAISVLMAVLLSFVIWIAPEIIRIIAGEKYMEAVYVVPPVSISVLLLFYSQLFINVEFYYEEKKDLVYASVGAAIANIVLNSIFIKLFGFVAAAYTTLFSYVVFAFSNYLSMKKVLKKNDRDDLLFDYKSLLLVFFAFVFCSTIGVLFYGSIIIRMSIVLASMLLILKRREKVFGEVRRIWREKRD